jgi:hypothetical protein
MSGTSHAREGYQSRHKGAIKPARILGPVVNWLILAGGREPHVGWWD